MLDLVFFVLLLLLNDLVCLVVILVYFSLVFALFKKTELETFDHLSHVCGSIIESSGQELLEFVCSSKSLLILIVAVYHFDLLFSEVYLYLIVEDLDLRKSNEVITELLD